MRPFVFATGGTAGHTNPAIALEQKLKSPVVFAGHGLTASPHFKKGMHRTHSIPSAPLTSIKAPFVLLYGIYKAYRLLQKEGPKAVIGFGSYHSFPVLVAAYLLNIPIIIFEPNAVLGKVNRLFANVAHLVLSQFDLQIPSEKIEMPLKLQGAITKEMAKKRYGLPCNDPVVLIFGGSLGAKVFEELTLPAGVEVIHFVGKNGDVEAVSAKYTSLGVPHFVGAYESEMEYAWKLADVAVTRSGALTVAEHLKMGVPTLFIPFPIASEDHQYFNAKKAGELFEGSFLLREEKLEDFPLLFEKLVTERALLQASLKRNLASRSSMPTIPTAGTLSYTLFQLG